MILFVLGALYGAALLFLLEPMFSRMVLPLLGGSSSVWTTCLLFYQATLLAGYAYSHAWPRYLGTRRHAALHLALLLLSILVLPLSVSRPAGVAANEHPTLWLLMVLTMSIGLPFLLLSSTAPLLQMWFARSGQPAARDPYFLYAASNTGSLLALASYPTLIEPLLGLSAQATLWSVAYVGMVVLIASCWFVVHRRAGDQAEAAPGKPAGTTATLAARARWTALSFVPSSLLLGLTTYLSTDIAAVPLLWVIPLIAYLLTFILAFARRQLIPQGFVLRWQLLLTVPLVLFLFWGAYLTSPLLLPLHLVAFFFTALMCHGELARTRPPSDELTDFYLWIAVGGALGGAFNVLVAPHVFHTVLEYPWMLVGACLLRPRSEGGVSSRPTLRLAVLVIAEGALVLSAFRVAMWMGSGEPPSVPTLGAAVVASAAVAVLCYAERDRPGRLALGLGSVVILSVIVRWEREDLLLDGRNFYGTYEVTRGQNGYHYLLHGTTIHGAQDMSGSGRDRPATYYAREGPLGDVFRVLPPSRRRAAIVGLGTGSIAAYARPEDEWVFYEIDPAIERIAWDKRLFTFLRDASGKIHTKVGDGRLLLARDEPGFYDLIVLDAFSSDAIPVHLLTREAMGIYLSKLAVNGLIVFHLSNRYLDLEPVIGSLVEDLGLDGRIRVDVRLSNERRRQAQDGSVWAIVGRAGESPLALGALRAWRQPRRPEGSRVWSDDYTSLLGLLKLP